MDRRSARTFSVAAALCLGLALAAAPARGTPVFTYLTQQRDVDASAGPFPSGGPKQTQTAPDFAPFSATVNASETTYSSTAAASLTSRLDPTVITLSGSASGNAKFDTIQAGGGVTLDVVFTLNESAPFLLSGGLGIGYPGPSLFGSISLTGPAGTVYSASTAGGHLVLFDGSMSGYPPIQGTLAPGQYELTASSGAYILPAGAHTGTCNGMYNVTLTVPEPAALALLLLPAGLALAIRRRR